MRIGNAFTLSAQNMAYENGSWWLPGVEVSGRSKTQCVWCGNYYYNDEDSELFRTTIVNFHSHPQASLSAPSAKDLLILANYGSDPTYTNYRGEIIVNCNENDTTLYFLMVKDRTRLKTLYDGIRNEIDMDAHLFINGGQCADYLEKNKRYLYSLSENERLFVSLKLVSDLYTEGMGIDIIKCQWSDNTNRNNARMSVFGIKKEKKKNGKLVLKPIKC
jgi:hypothetical protein